MRKSQRQHAFSWLGLILSTIVLAVFGFISVMATLSYNDCKELQTVIDKGIIVEGEIVALEYSSGVKYGSGSIYYIKYQYVDEDGKELASRNAQSEQQSGNGNKSGNKKSDNYFGK